VEQILQQLGKGGILH